MYPMFAGRSLYLSLTLLRLAQIVGNVRIYRFQLQHDYRHTCNNGRLWGRFLFYNFI